MCNFKSFWLMREPRHVLIASPIDESHEDIALKWIPPGKDHSLHNILENCSSREESLSIAVRLEYIPSFSHAYQSIIDEMDRKASWASNELEWLNQTLPSIVNRLFPHYRVWKENCDKYIHVRNRDMYALNNMYVEGLRVDYVVSDATRIIHDEIIQEQHSISKQFNENMQKNNLVYSSAAEDILRLFGVEIAK